MTTTPVADEVCGLEPVTGMGTNPLNPERLEGLRSYLTLLARMQLRSASDAKLDASEIVNATLLAAHQQRDQFRGSSNAQLAAWLRQILACNLADAYRAVHRAKRDVSRERSLEQALDASCTRLEVCLQAVQTSPSGKAVRNEQLLRLAWALGELPEAQRNAVELHHLLDQPLSAVAKALGRSEPAVAGLLRRGLKRLRELLDEQESLQ